MKQKFRACPFCGGGIELFWRSSDQHKDTSVRAVCSGCGASSPYVWLSTKGQDGMVAELEALWNRSIYDQPIKEKDATIKDQDHLIAELRLTEAEIMDACYGRRKQHDTARTY